MAFNDTEESVDNISSYNYYGWTDEQWIEEIKKFIEPKVYQWIFITLFILVFIFGLGGNFLVCFAVWRNHHLRTVTNYFLVNLACADFMVILVCLPLTLTSDITQSWFLGLVMCKISNFLQTVSILVSVLTLTAISIERYMAICHPLSFRESKFKSRLVIALVWIVSLASSVPVLVFLTLIPDDKVPPYINWLRKCKPRNYLEETIYQLSLTLLFYILPVAIMGFAYSRIAYCLWKSTTSIPVITNATSESSASTLRARKRTAKMLIVVVVLFFVCYLPVYMLNVLRYLGVTDKIQDVTVVQVFSLGSRWLCYFNSAFNPVIYNFMSEKFKKEFKMVCSCCTAKWIRLHNRRLYYEDPSEQPLRSKHANHKKFGIKESSDSTDATCRTEMIRLKSYNSHHVSQYRNNVI